MIDSLLNKLGYISKNKILTYAELKILSSDNTINIKKEQYNDKEITKWNYYKVFWFQKGIKCASINLEEFINKKRS